MLSRSISKVKPSTALADGTEVGANLALKGILWQKYKSGLKVVVFIDEIDGETHFAQLGSSWPGEPKMSRK